MPGAQLGGERGAGAEMGVLGVSARVLLSLWVKRGGHSVRPGWLQCLHQGVFLKTVQSILPALPLHPDLGSWEARREGWLSPDGGAGLCHPGLHLLPLCDQRAFRGAPANSWPGSLGLSRSLAHGRCLAHVC